MRWRFWRRRTSPNLLNGNRAFGNSAALKARLEAESKLREARQDWPRVHEAHDRLADWIDAALRGRGEA